MVPKVEDARQAEAIVRQLHYPPAGDRGVAIGSVRASRWGAIEDYMSQAAEQLRLIIQVETRNGLDNLPGLTAVEGVDGIFIGPNDLAAALGHPGEPSHPYVEAAIVDAASMLTSAGRPAGILVPASGMALVTRRSDAGSSPWDPTPERLPAACANSREMRALRWRRARLNAGRGAKFVGVDRMTTAPRRFDAIIVGAGQAGPPLAARLTVAGMTVALVERKLVGEPASTPAACQPRH